MYVAFCGDHVIPNSQDVKSQHAWGESGGWGVIPCGMNVITLRKNDSGTIHATCMLIFGLAFFPRLQLIKQCSAHPWDYMSIWMRQVFFGICVKLLSACVIWRLTTCAMQTRQFSIGSSVIFLVFLFATIRIHLSSFLLANLAWLFACYAFTVVCNLNKLCVNFLACHLVL